MKVLDVNRKIQSLYRYPVKGFNEESVNKVSLRPLGGFPMDRSIAFTNGEWSYDKDTYIPKNKTEFIGLMLHPTIAKLRLRADTTTGYLEIKTPDGAQFFIDTNNQSSGGDFINYLIDYLKLPATPKPKLVKGINGTFSDLAMMNRAKVHRGNTQFGLSVINLASVRDLEEKMGAKLDLLRFRANIYYDSDTPWEERGWFGRHLKIGSIVGKVISNTPRCAIPSVNPSTGQRDMNVLPDLLRLYNQKDIGFYVDVFSDGEISIGDTISLTSVRNDGYNLVTVPLNGVDYPLYVVESGN